MRFLCPTRGRLAALAVTAAALLAPSAARADFGVFSNPAPITIPLLGPATPYPSTILVAGLGGGPITDVTATITGFSHTSILDVDILLVAPGGADVELMSFVGTGGVVNVTYTFQDGAPFLPFIGSPPSGTYSPTQFRTVAYPAPAPGLPYGTAMSAFDGIDPNGLWSLYVVDRVGLDSGVIAGGWSLSITTAGTTAAVPEPASAALLGLGAAGLAVRRLRRRA